MECRSAYSLVLFCVFTGAKVYDSCDNTDAILEMMYKRRHSDEDCSTPTSLYAGLENYSSIFVSIECDTLCSRDLGST